MLVKTKSLNNVFLQECLGILTTSLSMHYQQVKLALVASQDWGSQRSSKMKGLTQIMIELVYGCE
jgi:hypothetical protein